MCVPKHLPPTRQKKIISLLSIFSFPGNVFKKVVLHNKHLS
jgi:hypothetical protein